MKISQSGPVQQSGQKSGVRGRLAGVLLVALASFASGLNAQQSGGPALNPAHPDTYVVKSGDTLWDISARFLRDPWYWPEIWYVNPQVENPHLVYPGDVLTLAYVDGKPQLRLQRGAATGTEKLSPRVREESLDSAIQTLPYSAVGAFLSKSMVLEKKEFEKMPYVVSLRDDHLVGATGNDVYVRGDAINPDGSYNLIHPGDKLIDPDDGDTVGYEGIFVAEGKVTRSGDPVTMQLNASAQEVVIGDRVASRATPPPMLFTPRAPDKQVEGRIIHVVDGVTQIGQYQVVIINRGARDGIEPGHVLGIWQAGERVNDTVKTGVFNRKVQLPDEHAGVLMVFKAYDRISYGLVMKASSAIHILDKVRNPD
jgi:LysM repeat protein